MFTLLAIMPIKVLISNCVGQLFWQGASAHFRQRAASRSAPRSLNVVGLISSKFSINFDQSQPLRPQLRFH